MHLYWVNKNIFFDQCKWALFCQSEFFFANKLAQKKMEVYSCCRNDNVLCDSVLIIKEYECVVTLLLCYIIYVKKSFTPLLLLFFYGLCAFLIS